MNMVTIGDLYNLLLGMNENDCIYASLNDKNKMYSFSLDYRFLSHDHVGVSIVDTIAPILVSDLVVLLENIDKEYKFSVFIGDFIPLIKKYKFTGRYKSVENKDSSILLEIME